MKHGEHLRTREKINERKRCTATSDIIKMQKNEVEKKTL